MELDRQAKADKTLVLSTRRRAWLRFSSDPCNRLNQRRTLGFWKVSPRHAECVRYEGFARSATSIDCKIWSETSFTAPGECDRNNVLVLSLSPMDFNVSKY